MNLAQALHTAARRYCINQHTYWATRYSEISSADRDRAGIFPRYNVLNTIRVELERIDPDKLTDLNATRDQIMLAGINANDEFTLKPIRQIDADAMANERKAFCTFIRELSDVELPFVEPLPYQRVLSKSESEFLWSQLRKRWNIADGYWFPLAECPLLDVAAFQDRYFNEFCSSFSLTNLLSARGISRIWELREYGPEYEQEKSIFSPHYDGAEGYWSSDNLDWIVYASHESSITVGGWLLTEVKDHWTEWEKRIWNSPFF
ncbi:MAG: hypothetical protein AAFQ89_11975 [Cyanobacteria bacterium J06626_18]